MNILRRIRSALGLEGRPEPDLTAGNTELSPGRQTKPGADGGSRLQAAVTEPNGHKPDEH